MKVIITENQFQKVLKKYLDLIKKNYEGKICRLEVDSSEEDNEIWINVVISQNWIDGNEETIWYEVNKLKKSIKNELNLMFTGKEIEIFSYVGNC